MKNMVINIVIADDWQGLYVNGILKFEAHRVDADIVLEAVKREVTDCDGINNFKYAISLVDQNWMEEQGSLPEYIKDIPEEIIL